MATEMWQALEGAHQRMSLMHVLGHILYMSIVLTLFLHFLFFPPVLPTFSCFSQFLDFFITLHTYKDIYTCEYVGMHIYNQLNSFTVAHI